MSSYPAPPPGSTPGNPSRPGPLPTPNKPVPATDPADPIDTEDAIDECAKEGIEDSQPL